MRIGKLKKPFLLGALAALLILALCAVPLLAGSPVYAGDKASGGGKASTAGSKGSSADSKAPQGKNAATHNSFIATITPTTVTFGVETCFDLTVTNVSTGAKPPKLGKVTVQVLDDFINVNNVAATSYHPNTDLWSSGFVSPNIWAIANSWNDCLQPNDYVVISFCATPAETALCDVTRTFDTTAYIAIHNPGAGQYGPAEIPGQRFDIGDADTLIGSQPTVTIECENGDGDGDGDGNGDGNGGGNGEEPEEEVPGPLSEGAVIGPPVLMVDMQGTVARYPVTQDGRLLVDALTTSPDGLVTLFIPAGSLVLNANATPAYLNKDPDVSSTTAATPQPPAGYTMVAAYEFLPSGITFSPDATLIIEYDANKVPADGVPIIAYYDEAADQWTDLETAGYVAAGAEVPNTVQAHTAHLTYFAILAK